MMRVIFLLLVLFTMCLAQGQSCKNKKALKKYQQAKVAIRNRDYDTGIALYRESIKADENCEKAYQGLVNAYTTMNLLSGEYNLKIKKCHQKIIEINESKQSADESRFQLGKIYFKEGNYQQATSLFEQIDNKKFKRFNYYLNSSQYATKGIKHPLVFNPQALSLSNINRFPHNSRPVLTSNAQTIVYCARTNKQPDENIYISHKTNNEWEMSTEISANINTENNEGMASISGDGKTLVFTRCNKKNSCDLYISYSQNNEWSVPKNLTQVNSGGWDSEASLSADGRSMLFSSNRKGGYGGFDIYFTKKNQSGNWSTPKNLGSSINTSYNEVTPFLHAGNERIYFASSGHYGYGGYDLFYSDKVNGKWLAIQNLGYPINTKDNEGSLFITTDSETAYYEKFTKDKRVASSKIYSFEMPKVLSPKNRSMSLSGKVIDAKTKEAIKASVIILDLNTKDTIAQVTSDTQTGGYSVVLTRGKEYMMWVEKREYLPHSENFELKNGRVKQEGLIVELQPLIANTSVVVLKNIFFESGSYTLQSKSFTELNFMSNFLSSYPNIIIRIDGHTDNTGKVGDNLLLSKNRAKSVYDYLLKKGVPIKQLNYKGYGEARPVVSNDTQEGKAKNRRIEFRILDIK